MWIECGFNKYQRRRRRRRRGSSSIWHFCLLMHNGSVKMYMAWVSSFTRIYKHDISFRFNIFDMKLQFIHLLLFFTYLQFGYFFISFFVSFPSSYNWNVCIQVKATAQSHLMIRLFHVVAFFNFNFSSFLSFVSFFWFLLRLYQAQATAFVFVLPEVVIYILNIISYSIDRLIGCSNLKFKKIIISKFEKIPCNLDYRLGTGELAHTFNLI